MAIKATMSTTFLIFICISSSLGQYNMDNLGDSINQQVQEGLKPVRIRQNTLRVKFGQRGTTVAKYSPSGKTLVIQNSRVFVCGGSISDKDGSCSGDLRSLDYKQNEDYCYSISKTQVNDQICVGSTGGISSSTINGKLTCKGIDGSPVLAMKAEDFRKLCANVANSVQYKYYTRENLADVGNGLACSGDSPQVCTYSERLLESTNGVTATNDSKSSASRTGSFWVCFVTYLLMFIFW